MRNLLELNQVFQNAPLTTLSSEPIDWVAQLSSCFHAANPSGTASFVSFDSYFDSRAAGNLPKSFEPEC
jgi:hypothetical protein